MGRLSTFAKNRILNLRFQKSYRIKQIASTLMQDDNIKVSRKSISTFLKKYIETKSINDKPRSGRNKKLTPEEINLIGEVTRLNRDITAPKIKEYLNLNVSTYTILRASKLFEWNKLNPNSNEAKKAAALERQLNGECKKKRLNKKRNASGGSTSGTNSKVNANNNHNNSSDMSESSLINEISPCGKETITKLEPCMDYNLNLIDESEILLAKNVSSSPMVFATKILYKIFELNELIGHNVSGKTFNKYIKNKKALDEKRINYIRYLVEKHFDAPNKEDLWKSCRTAINKSIRNNEIKYANSIGLPPNNVIIFQHKDEQIDLSSFASQLGSGACSFTLTHTNNNSILNDDNQLQFNTSSASGKSVASSNSSNSSSSSNCSSHHIILNSSLLTATTTNSITNSNDYANYVNKPQTEASLLAGTHVISLQPNMSIFQITNDLPPNCDDQNNNSHLIINTTANCKLNKIQFETNNNNTTTTHPTTSIVKLTDDAPPDLACDEYITENNKVYIHLNKPIKSDNTEDELENENDENDPDYDQNENDEIEAINSRVGGSVYANHHHHHHHQHDAEDENDHEDQEVNDDDGGEEEEEDDDEDDVYSKLDLLSESELIEIQSQCCSSPMIFATKVLSRIFTKDELMGHNVSGKTFHKNFKNKQPLDETRINYIRHLVETCFPHKKIDTTWKSCRKAINRVIRNYEIKESKLNKSIDDVELNDIFLH